MLSVDRPPRECPVDAQRRQTPSGEGPVDAQRRQTPSGEGPVDAQHRQIPSVDAQRRQTPPKGELCQRQTSEHFTDLNSELRSCDLLCVAEVLVRLDLGSALMQHCLAFCSASLFSY